jgi:acyl carrier protein phosphodiesterase
VNYLAHLVLSGSDENLRMGAMLGDFVRGGHALVRYSPDIRLGILLHRHIDSHADGLPDMVNLRRRFAPPFRRYAGIIVDLAFDHILARRWPAYMDVDLEDFDREIRAMLARHQELLPERLLRFMRYADRRGLFAAYRDRDEVLLSLTGVGTRLSRANPLGRVHEIWDELEPLFEASFDSVFRQLQSDAEAWLKSRSTTTGS